MLWARQIIFALVPLLLYTKHCAFGVCSVCWLDFYQRSSIAPFRSFWVLMSIRIHFATAVKYTLMWKSFLVFFCATSYKSDFGILCLFVLCEDLRLWKNNWSTAPTRCPQTIHWLFLCECAMLVHWVAGCIYIPRPCSITPFMAQCFSLLSVRLISIIV